MSGAQAQPKPKPDPPEGVEQDVSSPPPPKKRPNTRLGRLLVDYGRITHEQLDDALDKQAETGTRLGQLPVGLGLVEEEHLTKLLSQ